MSKISSQGTKFFVQDGLLTDITPVTAATKAMPPVLSVAAVPTGMVVGAIVVPNNTGWRSIEDRPLPITATAAGSITLGDSDTTDEAADFGAEGEVALASFLEVCMATLTFTSPAGAVIDTTTLCDVARQTVAGLPGVSTWQATGFWDASDAVQSALRALYRAGNNVVMKAIFRDGSGVAFVGGVNNFDIRAGIDQAVQITVGGNVSGQMTFIDADPALALVA